MYYAMFVMLCYVMLCYVMLCYVMLCYVMFVMLCYVMLCYGMLYYVMFVMLCYVMVCYIMLCYVMLCKLCKNDQMKQDDFYHLVMLKSVEHVLFREVLNLLNKMVAHLYLNSQQGRHAILQRK